MFALPQLQKRWSEEAVPVEVHESTTRAVSRLPLDKLRKVLPQIHDKMHATSLPRHLELLRTEQPLSIGPPDYISRAPDRADLWQYSDDGQEVSPLGCYPLINPVSTVQYQNVLKTLKRLKTLDMLLLLEDLELTKLTAKLLVAREHGKHGNLVESLLGGLESGQIHVYKGLDSAFRLPDESPHLWGLSDRTKGQVDIYVSQKAPSDVGVVLHTFLALEGVPRAERYEEELFLENSGAVDNGPQLPINLQRELEDSTTPELLFLLQQMRLSGFNHSFKTIIQETCEHLLIKEPSRLAWVEIHSRQFLEGSISIRDLLQKRLEHFARKGATKLPTIDALVGLYGAVEGLVANALFRADRKTLQCLLSSLMSVYSKSSGSSCADINADLFALMFFCCFRKAAFEDVYLVGLFRCGKTWDTTANFMIGSH